MEADVGAELMNRSSILKEVGLNVGVVVGDEDSSMIAAVRRTREDDIFELADSNHLKKHFSEDLLDLQKQFKEMRKRIVIPHLKKCFNCAVAQNKCNSTQLANALNVIPDHVFGDHENRVLKKLFEKYTANSTKFSVAASSQASESLNNIMAHKAPKNQCYSLCDSSDYRWASAVCTKNDGEQYLLTVTDKLNLSPRKNTKLFAIQQDEQRKHRASVAKSKYSKCRRNLSKQDREMLRKRTEKTEGIQYLSTADLILITTILSIKTVCDAGLIEFLSEKVDGKPRLTLGRHTGVDRDWALYFSNFPSINIPEPGPWSHLVIVFLWCESSDKMAYNLRRRTVRQELLDETAEVPAEVEEDEDNERNESEENSECEYSNATDATLDSNMNMDGA
ncbi:hypothetical protein PV327_011024 [Microctonus hyperodae]|uniref:Mutator-like transposase domain-containing protein n=1 Tax=Microctonus hyperodae TaxID=165561 RepID=A0AA39FRM7_MICHY|nr:hypothetical protein PV327_011024 [Microctonus hyperodae]